MASLHLHLYLLPPSAPPDGLFRLSLSLMVPSSPEPLPSSFDPAIFLHSELDTLPTPPSDNHSDDLEALYLQTEATKAQKNGAGVVIQHRAWKTLEIFRSEEDYLVNTPTKQHKPPPTVQLEAIPSSPPLATMTLISSPVAYPPTSSPAMPSPRKRRRAEDEPLASRIPLADVAVNSSHKVVGGFIMDEDEDEDAEEALEAIMAKRKKVEHVSETSSIIQTESVSLSVPGLGVSTLQKRVAVSHRNTFTMDQDALDLPLQTPRLSEPMGRKLISAVTSSGKTMYLTERRPRNNVSYEELIASRSTTKEGHATTSYYGINLHELMDTISRDEEACNANKLENVNAEPPRPSIEQSHHTKSTKSSRTLMWTEKYRARKFTDLIGDERTHRSVLRWLKAWDPIVFPGSAKPKTKSHNPMNGEDEQRHRKILLLTGPPGLGKTTLAHVCAKQAGYEVQEINASDERSRDVVRGRIRDMVGTENVKGIDSKTANGKVRKAGKPVCVVVDEVDGVVSGSGGGGEGGFIKALIDLIHLDQKNSNATSSQSTPSTNTRKKKGDRFRLLRPLVLICNDVYHPSLRPLRQSSIAEIIHIRKPPLNMVVSRMHSIFEKEGIPADGDGVRRLCEATWGVSNRKEGGTGSGAGEGDIRGVMVVGEWVAGRLRAAMDSSIVGTARLTRRWLEQHILGDLGQGGGAARGLGRGGAKEVVERIFLENAGFPKSAIHLEDKNISSSVGDPLKKRALDLLREMINTSGDYDRIVTDCFTSYINHRYQDDTMLSKPNTANSWLHFHDMLSTAVHSSQEWELAPYLSQTPLVFHQLFASTQGLGLVGAQNAGLKTYDADNSKEEEDSPHPFSGPGASWAAIEAEKQNHAILTSLQSGLSMHLTRMYRSIEDMATELVPYVVRMLSPDVKPVIINTSSNASSSTSKFNNVSTASVRRAGEKALVLRSVHAMSATGVRFERAKIDFEASSSGALSRPTATVSGGWIYRMDPALDTLASFDTMNGSKGGRADAQVRYAVRQVLESEYVRETKRVDDAARRQRGGLEADGISPLDASAGEIHENGKTKGPVDAAAAEKLAQQQQRAVKRDFFGRIIKQTPAVPLTDASSVAAATAKGQVRKDRNHSGDAGEERRVWVSFHEGFSNAVRKPISLKEFMMAL